MKPAKILAFALALLAGGIPAARAGDCAIAFDHADDGIRYGAAFGPSGQVFTWVGTGAPVARSGTAMGWGCRPGIAAGALHRVHGMRYPPPHHVILNSWWFWWGQPGWKRRGGRGDRHAWHGHRHDRRWHGKPPRRPHRARAHGYGWHGHRGWHPHPRHTRRHHGHDRREHGHRPRRRH